MNALDLKSGMKNCWNSEPSKNDSDTVYYTIYFNRDVLIEELKIQFQGGFVGDECLLYVMKDGNNWIELQNAMLEPEDSTEVQMFDLKEEESDETKRQCQALKLKFESSSDFYGRVTIYKIEVWGQNL